MNANTPERFSGQTFDHIPTNELRLLLKLAVSRGHGSAPNAKAYRAELRRRKALRIDKPEAK